MKKKVIIIGSGLRAQSALFPALWCLQDTHEVVGVYGRSKKELRLMNGALHIQVADSLSMLPIAEADIIIAAVTKENVPALLRDLSAYDTRKAVLMLDTPVLPFTGILAMRYFRRFKKVLVSEDTIALPPHLLARQIIQNGTIGTLKTIYFFHNGYIYHAAASLKMLSGNLHAGFIKGKKFYTGTMQKEFHFPNGVRGVLFEPRDYDKGKFLIEGSKGFIADYDFAGGAHERIGYLRDGEMYQGLTLNGTPVPQNDLDKKYLVYMTKDVPELSLMNSMKIRGLMDLVVAATEETSPFHYSPISGFFDNLLMVVAGKMGIALG